MIISERVRAMISLDDGVERPGPNRAPTAFRIWKAGDNPTSKGMARFTEYSAQLVMGDFLARGNLLSIDIDHMSLDPNAPPQNHGAAGWHSLQVRPGPELWAVGVQWVDWVQAGLEKDPPEWRYFSPAFDVDKATREVILYLNTALTNNPATWHVTQLASRGTEECHMALSKSDLLAFVKHVASGGGEGAAEACAAIMAMIESTKAAEVEPAPDSEKKEEESAKATEADEEDAEEAPPDSEKKEEPAKATIGGNMALLTRLQAVEVELANKRIDEERERLIASRKDFTADTRKALTHEPLEHVKFAVKNFPIIPQSPAAVATVQATLGETQRTDGALASRLPPADALKMKTAMGLHVEKNTIKWEGCHRIFPTSITREEALAILKANGAEVKS